MKILFSIVTLLFLPFSFVFARAPLYSELISASNSATAFQSYVVVSTTTDPLFIETLSIPQISGGSGVGIFCGTTRIYYGDESNNTVATPNTYIAFSPPYVCTGSVWFSTIDTNVNWPVTVSLTGYSMTSANYDASSGGGGGGGGTTTVDVALSATTSLATGTFDGFFLVFGIMLSMGSLVFVVWYFKPRKT